MTLEQIQRDMFEVVRTPLAPQERSRAETLNGRTTRAVAEGIIRPNHRLTSLQRLEIYNRQYWFRLIGALMEDFEGLRAIVGKRRFYALAIAYLNDCPSQSFTLRDLGSRLPKWLKDHPEFGGRRAAVAIDMARLEWAEVEAFDSASVPAVTLELLPALGDDPKLRLQPHIRLLTLSYDVDEYLLNVRRRAVQARSSVDSSTAIAQKNGSTRIAALQPAKQAIYVALHRHEDAVYFKRLEREAYELLGMLARGCALSAAIDSVDWRDAIHPEVAMAKVQGWFANWASLGWLAC